MATLDNGTTARFAVIFDTHYCLGSDSSLRAGSGVSDDIPRYAWMRRELFPQLIAELREHSPGFCLCTGDIIEGARRPDVSVPGRELAEVFARFGEAGLPVLNALGTHEPKAEYAEIALPLFSRFIGKPVSSNHFSFDTECGRFVLLDYLSLEPGSDQAVWFRKQCAEVPAERPLFVFAHAPVANFARPLFSHAPMQQVLADVFADCPPTAFFCGHTHNQALSYHRLADTGFTQIKGSSVGFPVWPLERLENRHALLISGEDTYFWGVPEDVAPGYWICDVFDDMVKGAWYGIGKGLLAEIAMPLRGGNLPEVVKAPDYPDLELKKEDLPLIRTAALEYFLRSPKDGAVSVVLNGIDLGQAPAGRYYAARNLLPLSPSAVATLTQKNRLILNTDFSGPWMLGGLRLAATTLDGRHLTSRCFQEVAVTGSYAAELAKYPLAKVLPDEQTVVEIELQIHG